MTLAYCPAERVAVQNGGRRSVDCWQVFHKLW